MWRVQLEENAIFQIPSSLASHSAPPSLFSEISINPWFTSSAQWVAQAQAWGLTEAPGRPWAEPPKERGCPRMALTPSCESLGQAFPHGRSAGRVRRPGSTKLRKTLHPAVAGMNVHHLDEKIFPWWKDTSEHSFCHSNHRFYNTENKQAGKQNKKERGLVVVSLKNKQSSHEVRKSFQYYILILHRRQSDYNPQEHCFH